MTRNVSATSRARAFAAARAAHPGWHFWTSSSGRAYATGTNHADPRMQVTLDADTPAGIGAVVGAWEAAHGGRRAA